MEDELRQRGTRLRILGADLKLAILFCTRLRLGPAQAIEGADLARASWAFPLAGALVAMIGAAAYWLAYRLRLPAPSAAMLALAATLLATGALHEDGLADTADGFGGGSSRERKLEIMHDSRIGTYGVCALITSLLLRWSALMAVAVPKSVALALIAAHVSARAILPAFMRLIPPARRDGLSAKAGPPPWESVAVAGILGVAGLVVGLGPTRAVFALILLGSVGALLAWLSLKHIQGQTGDVLGAVEQTGETLILLLAARLLPAHW